MKRSLIISLVILLFSVGSALNAQTKKNEEIKKNKLSLNSLIFKNLTNRIVVGYNNPSQYYSGTSTTYFNGLKIGLTTELGLKHNMSLLTGVLYNMAYSDKLQGYPKSATVNYMTYGHFLNVPLLATYTLPVTKNFKFIGSAGPNLNIGLMQRRNTLSTYNVSTAYSIPSTYTNLYTSDLNRLDLQIELGGGVQLYKYQLKGGYNYGLLNMSKAGHLYQRGWFITLGVTL